MRRSERLHHALEHARHALPAQGPIGVFVHHNTLHASQHLGFHEAIAAACDLHDAQGYWSEERYRAAIASGRIDAEDLDHALVLRSREAPDRAIGPLRLREIERLALVHGIDAESPAGLRWAIGEREVTARLRPDLDARLRGGLVDRTRRWLERLEGADRAALDAMLGPLSSLPDVLRELATDPERAATEALWAASRALAPARRVGLRQSLLERTGRDRTHRDLVVALGAPDPAIRTNETLVRFLEAYLDEGMARWAMPGRERGLLACFVEHLSVVPSALERWQRRALARLRSAQRDGRGAVDLATGILDELEVEPDRWDAYLTRVLLEQPGWSGMIARLEASPADRGPDAPPASLLELAAIRLALGIESLAVSARRLDHTGSLGHLPETARRIWAKDERRRAHDAPWRLFQLAQLAGLAAPELLALGATTAATLVDALDAFDPIARQRTLHEAYEHHHLREVLGAIQDNVRRPAYPEPPDPRFQLVVCIDDREESFRRHFEELDPRHATLSTAGFFGVAMRYTGLDDPSPAALCPVVVTPGHSIRERPHPEHAAASESRRSRRAALARVRHELEDASRSFARGALLTPALGLLAAFPLAARVLAPRLSAALGEALEDRLLPAPRTRLALDHRPGEGAASPAVSLGFTVAEQAERVRGQLENMGLTRRFAPLVVLLGHGATTVNNPHHSAYECGACGGRSGGPNARAYAAMANDPAVRAALRGQGVAIPDGTWFVGGLHDTTSDAITLFDLELVPASHRGELEGLIEQLDRARALSAHERCRRFEHARDVLGPEDALAHVEERSVDLGQARPELGHVTNAVCVVGPRELTRGLFLDRRAFLQSYDPSIDPEGRILERVLAAVVPVGAGISLEYYFSTVDDERWGCGTKLPHNLASLLGVMEGAGGDLRTGLPRQMIEIHEPLRLLCIVVASPETLLAIAGRQREVGELVGNRWVRLVSMHPDTGALAVLGPDGFEPWRGEPSDLPVVACSTDWYVGKQGFVPPARVAPPAAGRGPIRREAA